MDQNPDDAVAVWVERLAELIREEGYRAKIRPSGNIESGAGGYKIFVIPYPPDNFQLGCGVKMDGLGLTAEDTNRFNAQYRFGKLYIDDKGDLVLTADIIADVTQPSAQETVRQAMILFEGALRLLREKLDSQQSAA